MLRRLKSVSLKEDMDDKIKVLAIVGSIREDSYNKQLALSAKKLAPENLEIEVFIPDQLPLFTQDLEKNPPKPVQEYKRKIEEADGILFVSPEHNFTIPAVLKNAIEWGNRPYGDNSFFNKPGAVIGASTGSFGTIRVQNHFRLVFVDLSIITFNWPQLMVKDVGGKFDKDGDLTDKETTRRLKDYLEHLYEFIRNVPKEKELFTIKG